MGGVSHVAVYHRNELDNGTFPYVSRGLPAGKQSLYDYSIQQQTEPFYSQLLNLTAQLDLLTTRTFGVLLRPEDPGQQGAWKLDPHAAAVTTTLPVRRATVVVTALT